MSRDILIFVLQSLGVVINFKKSIPQPSQQMEFLGLTIDTLQMTTLFTEEKIQKVIKCCQELYQNSQITLLKLRKLIALLSSTAQVVLPAQIQYRYLHELEISKNLKL